MRDANVPVVASLPRSPWHVDAGRRGRVGAWRARQPCTRGSDLHRGWPVHGQLHLSGLRRHLHRAGRALREHRSGHRHGWLSRGLAPARDPGRGHRASRPGTLVYSSWVTMQSLTRPTRTPAPTTIWRWFGSIPADVGRVNPSVPGYRRSHRRGRRLRGRGHGYSYGNSSLRIGVTIPEPKFREWWCPPRAAAGAAPSTP